MALAGKAGGGHPGTVWKARMRALWHSLKGSGEGTVALVGKAGGEGTLPLSGRQEGGHCGTLWKACGGHSGSLLEARGRGTLALWKTEKGRHTLYITYDNENDICCISYIMYNL